MKKNNIYIFILSFLFSFFMLFGTSFLLKGNCSLIFSSLLNITISTLIFILLYIMFFFLLTKLFIKLDNITFNNKIKQTKIYKLFDKHPFLFCIVIIIICWLPYIIAFYPIILSPDPSFQIKQFFGIPNKYSTYSILLDNKVIITNHHPVLHTLLLGSCLKLGTIIGNHNLGLFFYSVIQIIILSSAFSYTIVYMKKQNISFRYLMIVLAIYSLVPVFGFYSMSAVKDVIFGSFIILYIIFLYDCIKYQNVNLKKIIMGIIIMIFICLFRNNGIYVIFLTFPLLFLTKKNFSKYLIIFLTTITFYGVYDKIILPFYKITPTSIREVLSIPFQQTARYIKYNEKSVTEKEKEAIDKILIYDTLASRYNPELADPVKNEFNRYSTSTDLKEYFEAWFTGLKKNPGTYIEATMNNTYGYFYPLKTSWYFYHKYDTRIVEDDFNYHYNSLDNFRKSLTFIGIIFPYIPVLGLIVNIGFSSWIIFTMCFYLLYKNKIKSLIYLSPALVLILVCIASPANTYFRYALPYIFGMPLMIGLFIDVIKKE